MRGLRHISIRWKLTLIIMAASTIALLLVWAGFVSYEMFAFRRTMVRDLLTLADIIGTRSTAALSFEDRADAKESLSSLRANKHIISACFYRNGRVFAAYNRNGRAGTFPEPQPDGAFFAGDKLQLFHKIIYKGEDIGVLFLQSDLDEISERVHLYAGIILFLMVGSLAVTFALSALLQRVITRPIIDLALAAKTVTTEQNYSVRTRKHAEDELGQLMDGFNAMIDQIQSRDAARHLAERFEARMLHGGLLAVP